MVPRVPLNSMDGYCRPKVVKVNHSAKLFARFDDLQSKLAVIMKTARILEILPNVINHESSYSNVPRGFENSCLSRRDLICFCGFPTLGDFQNIIHVLHHHLFSFLHGY